MGRIYTKSGDGGQTRTATGREISKGSQLAETLGALDEFNSLAGWGRFVVREKGLEAAETELVRVQAQVMTIGGILSGGKGEISDRETIRLEKLMDKWQKELPKLKGFVYPDGPLHPVRAAARRAERETVKLLRGGEEACINRQERAILRYLNRVSDMLFMLARKVNSEYNLPERLWKGKTESKRGRTT